MTSATMTAMKSVSPMRHPTKGHERNAAKVEAITMGFTTGAASRSATAEERGIPLRRRLRARGMFPHSHTGKMTPRRETESAERTVFRGRTFVIHSDFTKI